MRYLPLAVGGPCCVWRGRRVGPPFAAHLVLLGSTALYFTYSGMAGWPGGKPWAAWTVAGFWRWIGHMARALATPVSVLLAAARAAALAV